ncbi:MAG: phytoene/squalene synthase family protein [Pseudomonadota bacterium]
MNEEWLKNQPQSRHDYGWLERQYSDLAICREMLREGSHSFYAASLLLPADVREPACALYAFCRLADDAVDDGGHQEDAVAMLSRRLDLIYAGTPFDHAADRAMVHIAEVYNLPRELLDALIDGFRWDLDGRHYDTIESLYAYGARVAGTVGAMMSVLMGVRNSVALARAADMGVAMQLTNIARDVGEDARNGRLYLPRNWLIEASIDPEAFIAAPVFSPELGTVIERLLAAADVLYRRARSGIGALPVGCRPGIHAAMAIYREIGVVLRKTGLDSVNQRAYVSTGRKSVLLGQALMGSLASPALNPAPPLAETEYLVNAVEAAGAAPPVHKFWFA